MRREILTYSDSNMAGYEWTWMYTLESQPGGTYVLSAMQDMMDQNYQPDALLIEPVKGIRRGADLFQHLDEMLEEASSNSLEDFDIEEIAKELLPFDEKLADQFLRGKRLLERRDQRRERDKLNARSKALAPFKEMIEKYCRELDDTSTRGPAGISRPSERTRVRSFLEDYVAINGRLPIGFHSWQRSNGFGSGSHDFGLLGLCTPTVSDRQS